MPGTTSISAIDSHTAGEPTRVVLAGVPDALASARFGTVAERRAIFRERFDHLRSAIVNEPRGSDALVGALVVEPSERDCVAGVIFFNNVGYLNMCGHGTIGLVATLAHIGRIGPGCHRFDTPVGVVLAELLPDGRVALENVACFRTRKDVVLAVPGSGRLRGDVAWGGNWFFLCADHGQEIAISRVRELTDHCLRIREALRERRITGDDGTEIDHIELLAPPSGPHADARNFVLCPGGAYDRSPCGTGTCAKLACLHADGALAPGQVWRQESIVGTVFEAKYEVIPDDPRGAIIPTILGRAHVNAECTLLLDETDPFCWGIR
jgi:4-hydroxyproline epimerase